MEKDRARVTYPRMKFKNMLVLCLDKFGHEAPMFLLSSISIPTLFIFFCKFLYFLVRQVKLNFFLD